MDRMMVNKFEVESEFLKAAELVVLAEERAAVDARGSFLLGVSGGKTPRALYLDLANKLDWKKTEVFLVDERFVSWENEKSNFKLLKESLMGGVEERMDRLHDFETRLEPRECLKKYVREIESMAPEGLDLAILGIGKDGHFASIFPGFEKFDGEEVVLATETLENEVRQRYSLSPNYLMRAKKILVLMAGADKLAVLEELLHGKKSEREFPCKFLLKHQNLTINFLKQ